MRCVVEESFDVIYLELSDGRSKQFHTYSAAACIYLAQQAEKDEGMSLIWREMRERHVADNT
eukprot:scaffold7663_cov88-Skeletonema_dohrnii-CCMP3373.AAC.3